MNKNIIIILLIIFIIIIYSKKENFNNSSNEKPLIFSILLFNYAGPIVDQDNNKFNSSDYLCEIIRTNNHSANNFSRDNGEIGIGPNGVWCINNNNAWTYFVLKFTPIKNFNIISNASLNDLFRVNTVCKSNFPNTGHSSLLMRDVPYKYTINAENYYILDYNGIWKMMIPRIY